MREVKREISQIQRLVGGRLDVGPGCVGALVVLGGGIPFPRPGTDTFDLKLLLVELYGGSMLANTVLTGAGGSVACASSAGEIIISPSRKLTPSLYACGLEMLEDIALAVDHPLNAMLATVTEDPNHWTCDDALVMRCLTRVATKVAMQGPPGELLMQLLLNVVSVPSPVLPRSLAIRHCDSIEDCHRLWINTLHHVEEEGSFKHDDEDRRGSIEPKDPDCETSK